MYEHVATKTTPKRSTYEHKEAQVVPFEVIFEQIQSELSFAVQVVAFVKQNCPNGKHLLNFTDKSMLGLGQCQ